MGLVACGGSGKGTPDAAADAKAPDAKAPDAMQTPDAAPDAKQGPDADLRPDAPPPADADLSDAKVTVDACISDPECTKAGPVCLEDGTSDTCVAVAGQAACFHLAGSPTTCTGRQSCHQDSGVCECDNEAACSDGSGGFTEGNFCSGTTVQGRYHCSADEQGCFFQDDMMIDCSAPAVCDTTAAPGEQACVCPADGTVINAGCSDQPINAQICSTSENPADEAVLTCGTENTSGLMCKVWALKDPANDNCGIDGLKCTGDQNGQPFCVCPDPPVSDFYADAQPTIDQKRQARPQLVQTGVRFPTICSFETMTLALDHASTATGPGHSGVARAFADNVVDNCKSVQDLNAHDQALATGGTDPHPECSHESQVLFGSRLVGPEGNKRLVTEEYPWVIFQNVTVTTTESSVIAGGSGQLHPYLFELIVNNSTRALALPDQEASITLQGSAAVTGFGGSLQGIWVHEGDCNVLFEGSEDNGCVLYRTAVDVLDFGHIPSASLEPTPRLDRVLIDGSGGFVNADIVSDTPDGGLGGGSFAFNSATGMVTFTPDMPIPCADFTDVIGDCSDASTEPQVVNTFVSFTDEGGHGQGGFLILSNTIDDDDGVIDTVTFYDPAFAFNENMFDGVANTSYYDTGSWRRGVRVGTNENDIFDTVGANALFQDIGVVNFASTLGGGPNPTTPNGIRDSQSLKRPAASDDFDPAYGNRRVGVEVQNDYGPDSSSQNGIVNRGGIFVSNDIGWLIRGGVVTLTDDGVGSQTFPAVGGAQLRNPTIDGSLYEGIEIQQDLGPNGGNDDDEDRRTTVTLTGVTVSNTMDTLEDDPCDFADHHTFSSNGINLWDDADLTIQNGNTTRFPAGNRVEHNQITGLAHWQGTSHIFNTTFFANGFSADEDCTLGNGVSVYGPTSGIGSDSGVDVEWADAVATDNWDNGVWNDCEDTYVFSDAPASECTISLAGGSIDHNGSENPMLPFDKIGISGNGLLSNRNSVITTGAGSDDSDLQIATNAMAGIYMTDGFLDSHHTTVTGNATDDVCEIAQAKKPGTAAEGHVMAAQFYDRSRFHLESTHVDSNEGGGILVDTLGGFYTQDPTTDDAPLSNAIDGGSVKDNAGVNGCDDNWFHAGGDYNTHINAAEREKNDAIVVTVDGRLQFVNTPVDVGPNNDYGLNVSGLVDFPDATPFDDFVDLVQNEHTDFSGFPNDQFDNDDSSFNEGEKRTGINLDGNLRAGLWVSCDINGKSCQLKDDNGDRAGCDDQLIGKRPTDIDSDNLVGDCLSGVECGNVFLSGGHANGNGTSDLHGDGGAFVQGSLFANGTAFNDNVSTGDDAGGVVIDAQANDFGQLTAFDMNDNRVLLDGKTDLVNVEIAGNLAHGVRILSAPYNGSTTNNPPLSPPTNVVRTGDPQETGIDCTCDTQGNCSGADCITWGAPNPDNGDHMWVPFDVIENPLGSVRPGIVPPGPGPNDGHWAFIIRATTSKRSMVHDNGRSGFHFGSTDQQCQIWAEVRDTDIIGNTDFGIDVEQNASYHINHSVSHLVCQEDALPNTPKVPGTQLPACVHCDPNENDDTPGEADQVGCTASTILSNNIYNNGLRADHDADLMGGVHLKESFLKGVSFRDGRGFTSNNVHHNSQQDNPTCSPTGIDYGPQMWIQGPVGSTECANCNNTQSAYTSLTLCDTDITNQKIESENECLSQNDPQKSDNSLNNHCSWNATGGECRVAWDISGICGGGTSNSFYHYTATGLNLPLTVGLFISEGAAVWADSNLWEKGGKVNQDWALSGDADDVIAGSSCGSPPLQACEGSQP